MFCYLIFLLPSLLFGELSLTQSYANDKGYLGLEYRLNKPSDDIVSVDVNGERREWVGKLVLDPVIQGQEYVCIFYNKESKPIKHVRFTPAPFIVESNGRRVKMHSIDSSGRYFQMDFEGFEPGEELSIASFSHGEQQQANVKLSEKMQVMHSPAVVGREYGVGRLKIDGEEFGMSLKLRWGPEKYRRVRYEDWVAENFLDP